LKLLTNITNFGAFVDIGVHQDGLVHVSHISDKFVSNPADVVSVQQKVQVTVIEIDLDRKRIALSMKADPFAKKQHGSKNPKKNFKSGKLEGNMQEKLAMLKGKFGK